MEGYVEGSEPSEEEEQSPRVPMRMTTRAGSGFTARAGVVAARSSGGADGTSPVHNDYSMAAEMVTEEEEEVDDLLSSHMEFISRYTGVFLVGEGG